MTKQHAPDIPDPEHDILFTCGPCGKSLVINARGAGMVINCPDCGAELQVPPIGNQTAGPPSDPVPGAENGDLPDISDVLADSREQIAALSAEIEGLQNRRQFLEKHYALTSQRLQALRRDADLIRTALAQMDEDLRALDEQAASDAQPLD